VHAHNKLGKSWTQWKLKSSWITPKRAHEKDEEEQNTMTQKQYPRRTKNYHEHDQEKQGANMQMWLTLTFFCGVASKETLEDFFHCPYFYYYYFLTN
jgi:hypothetical protein